MRAMTHEDLSVVSDIERRSYDFPWSYSVFRDCLLAGYQCLVLICERQPIAYGILSVVASEANILNLCVDPNYRALGYGERLLDEMLDVARDLGAREIFLEVRPSNVTALGLYQKKGFHQIARRSSYYQAIDGREDAAVLAKQLGVAHESVR